MNYGVSFDFHEQMFKRINRVKLNHTNKGVIINTIAVQFSKIVGKFHFETQDFNKSCFLAKIDRNYGILNLRVTHSFHFSIVRII